MNETNKAFATFVPMIERQLNNEWGAVPASTQLVLANVAFQTQPLQPPTGGQEDLQTGWWSSPKWPSPNAKDALTGVVWVATRVFAEAQRRERRWNVALVAMKDEIQSLSRQLNELSQEIGRLQNLRSYVVPLTTLSPGFQMRQQIPVTIEGDGENFTATFVEANVSASGETEGDAIANFKDSLVSRYDVLASMPGNQLGPLPARQWEVLHSVVSRTGE